MRLINGSSVVFRVEEIPIPTDKNQSFYDGCRYMQKRALRILHAYKTIDAVPVAQLREMLSNLEKMCRGGDEGETYTTGYRNGHHNGQIELLRYILQVPDGTSEDERKDGEQCP